MENILSNENIISNEIYFYCTKNIYIYQIKIYFIEWKYIFHQLKKYFLSNENDFYLMQI